MGVARSRPSYQFIHAELFYPSETVRRCTSNPCWCQRGQHRNSRYFHVEAGGDGPEQYHDLFDYMDRVMMGGGGMGMMPWKQPRDWRSSDYDILGEAWSEYHNRAKGRRFRPEAMPPWTAGDGVASPLSRRGNWDGPTRSDWERLSRYVQKQNEILRDLQDRTYGSAEEMRDEQWRQRQFRLWQKFQQQAMNAGFPFAGGFGMQSLQGMMNPNMTNVAFDPRVAQQFGAMGMNGPMPHAGVPNVNSYMDPNAMMSGGLPGPGHGGGGYGGRRAPFRRGGRPPRRDIGFSNEFGDDLDGGFGHAGGRGWNPHRENSFEDDGFGGFHGGE